MTSTAQKFIIILLLATRSLAASAQACCAGGSGSPIAGGVSQGVLQDGQAEFAVNMQMISSNKFLSGDSPARNFLKSYDSKYVYSRAAYGVTDKLTFSIESGYYIDRTQIGLGDNDKVTSGGIGDLILFPRYNIYQHNTEKTRNEVTVGLGYKMPLGKYLDSSVVYTDPKGKQYFTPMPPAVMPTTGAQDFIFYAFGYRGYPEKKISFFTSLLYLKKGWNPLGQKFGDFASVGLFVSKTVLKKLGVTLQAKGEWVDFMKYDHKIDMLATYNIDVKSTGGTRILLAPQLSYSYKAFTGYVLGEFPIYQYVNGTAIASQYLFTTGISYRFSTNSR